MTTGQTRVFVLLIILAALELLIQPFPRSVIHSAWTDFNQGLTAASGGK